MDNSPVKLGFCKSHPDAVIPRPQTEGSAGADISAIIENRMSFILLPWARQLFRTGLRFAIPKGFEVQIRPRSGLALKHGITVLNAPATVDSDYTGEVKVLLCNMSDTPYEVQHLDRIAQIVLAPASSFTPFVVDKMDQTDRGDGGFGSTGFRG